MKHEDLRHRFRRDGYIVVEDVFSKEEVKNLDEAARDLLEQSRAVRVSDDLFDLEPDHTAESPKLRRVRNAERAHPVFRAAISHDGVREVVQTLLGPNVRYQEVKLNMKSAAGGAPVRWHQDWAFIPHTNEDLLTVGIAIDDMTERNGPLRVIPGSHRGRLYSHHRDGFFCGYVWPDIGAEVEAGAVDLLAPAGSITVHHTRTIHGSRVNSSGDARRLLLMDAGSADAWPILGLKDGLEGFHERLLFGEEPHQPRVEPVEVLIPLPVRPHVKSIFDVQEGAELS